MDSGLLGVISSLISVDGESKAMSLIPREGRDDEERILESIVRTLTIMARNNEACVDFIVKSGAIKHLIKVNKQLSI